MKIISTRRIGPATFTLELLTNGEGHSRLTEIPEAAVAEIVGRALGDVMRLLEQEGRTDGGTTHQGTGVQRTDGV